jgi:hypothetical protein
MPLINTRGSASANAYGFGGGVEYLYPALPSGVRLINFATASPTGGGSGWYGNSSITLATPVQTKAGDLIVALCGVAPGRGTSSFTFNAPSGWTSASTFTYNNSEYGAGIQAFQIIAPSSGAVSYTFTTTGTSNGGYGNLYFIVFRGATSVTSTGNVAFGAVNGSQSGTITNSGTSTSGIQKYLVTWVAEANSGYALTLSPTSANIQANTSFATIEQVAVVSGTCPNYTITSSNTTSTASAVAGGSLLIT